MRRAVPGVAALVLAAAAVVGPASSAAAATVSVTTTLDVVDGGDVLVSLREAVDVANAAAEPTTVELPAGTYVLDVCGPDDDDNASGDLDVTTSQPVVLAATGAVVDQQCPDQRVVHTLDAAGDLTVEGGTLTGGEEPFVGASGGAVLVGGTLRLDATTVSGNDSGSNSALDNDTGITTGQDILLTDAVIGPNTGDGVGISFGTVDLVGTTVSGNTGRGVGLVDGLLSVATSDVSGNGGAGARTTGQGSGLLTVTDSTFTGNGGTGLACSNCGDLMVSRSVIADNVPTGSDPGGGIRVAVDQDDATDDLSVELTDVTLTGNESTTDGAGLGITITELVPEAPPLQVVLDRTTLAENTVASGRGGGLWAATGDVLLRNSTVTGNAATTDGGGVSTATGDLRFEHATVVDNDASTGADLAVGGDLSAFGSVVSGGGSGMACAVNGTTSSSGYNVDGGLSCGFAGTGDQSNVMDAQLEPLTDNGGATPTRSPSVGSPVVGAVPAAACTVVTTDQREVVRPQGTDCEAGAVEVAEEPPEPTCTKTGTEGPDLVVGTGGDDVLCGLGGFDLVLGLGGDDVLLGGDGPDLLLGGPGADDLRGEAGTDTLVGGPGADDLDGGPGADLCLDGGGASFC